MNRRAFSLAALAGLASPLLAACGSSENRATTPDSSAKASEPITVTDSRGKIVKLEAPATRVVTLEWGNTEDVLSLGLQPVGVADPKGFASWNTSVKLDAKATDVGLRTEPSLESVAKCEPDLILGVENSIPAAAIAQMEKIAPVVLLKGADATRPLALMRENFNRTALLIGRQDKAKEVLRTLDDAINSTRSKLVGKTNDPFALVYLNVTGNTVDVRMHAKNSLPGALAEQIGLTNAWAAAGDAAWGLASVDLEGLTKLPATTRLLHWTNKQTPDPTAGALKDNPLWNKLPFVANKKVQAFGDGVWFYGGPSSMVQLLDAFVAAYK